MRQFKWIEWNLQKIAAHSLSAEEVEAAFDRVFSLKERKDGSFQMFAESRPAAGSGSSGATTKRTIRFSMCSATWTIRPSSSLRPTEEVHP